MLTTTERVARFRTVTGVTPLDPTLGEALSAADAIFKEAIGYDPEYSSTARYERRSGNGTPILSLSRENIVSVLNLSVGGADVRVLNPIHGGVLIADERQPVWIPDHRRWIEGRDGYVFPDGRGNILVGYTAGFVSAEVFEDGSVVLKSSVPDDVQTCVSMLAGLIMEERNYLGLNSKRLGAEDIPVIARNQSDYEFIRRVISSHARHCV